MPPVEVYRVSAPPPRPLMIYDGTCGFCRHWIQAWARLTGSRVEYIASQDLDGRFPEIPPSAYDGAVQLIEPDGRVYAAAHAVLRAMREVPRYGLGYRLYCHLPPFAWLAERVYALIAAHREEASRWTRLLAREAPAVSCRVKRDGSACGL
jgi:predicted DCC family thiol-disulfide oxidoreductase YuxK